MIVGMPYQDEEIVVEELDGLLLLEPDLCQFLIYGPTPGTPFFDRVMEDDLLREDLAADAEAYYKECDGFSSMVTHPKLAPETVEALQRRCFDEDFQRLGPSIYRTLATRFKGWRTLSASANPALRRKAERFAHYIRQTYPVFLAGRWFGPNRLVRHRIGKLYEEIQSHLGRPSIADRLRAIAAAGMALWTATQLKWRIFQHPRLVRHVYRLPEEAPRPARVWRRLTELAQTISVEQRPERTIWVRLNGVLESEDAARLACQMRRALRRTRDRLVLDLNRLTELENEAAKNLAESLRDYRERIRILAPAGLSRPDVARTLAVFSLYHGAALAS